MERVSCEAAVQDHNVANLFGYSCLVSHIQVLVAKLSHYKGSHAHGEVKADLFIFLNLVLLPLVSITFVMS
jgi:nitrate reductase NapE component